MWLRKLLFFLIFFLNQFLFSQNETKKWYMGAFAGIDFVPAVPVSIANSAMASAPEGGSSIADANGNTLFYTDGLILYGSNNFPTPNGNGLNGSNTATQNALFIEKPGNPNIICLLIIGGPANVQQGPYTLYYNEIDKTLNGGIGDITIKNLGVTGGISNCAEKLCATKHCNNTDYWIVTHDETSTVFRTFLLTSAGITSAPVVSNVGTFDLTGGDTRGQIKISPNGTKLASALFTSGAVEVLDFNKLNGNISNPILLNSIAGQRFYGVEFSPDNTKLYGSAPGASSSIYQWDICAGGNNAIANSGIIVGTSRTYSLQLASDNKIYGSSGGSTFVNAINLPNTQGLACNFIANAISTAPNLLTFGLPNFSSDYFNKTQTISYVNSSQVNATNCLNNGQASVALCQSFGVGPFTYSWSNNVVFGPTSMLNDTVTNLSPGNYSLIITDAACMSDTVYFTITGTNQQIFVTQNKTICLGANFTLPGGGIVNTAGTYKDTVLSSGGCDSIITTILNVVPFLTSTQITNRCAGQGYILPGGSIVNTSGIYIDTLQTSAGCDSIITTTLNFIATATSSQSILLCNGNSYTLPGGTLVTTAGSYQDTLTGQSGCDSIITTTITIKPNATNTQSHTMCSGNSFTLPSGTVVITSGIYFDTLVSFNGCDSITTTTIIVNTPPIAGIGSNVTILPGMNAVLIVTGGATYNWIPSIGLNTTTNDSVLASPDETTTYCVEVTDNNGCKDTACVTVFVEITCPTNENLYLPNAFSPNADGSNDEFCLQGWDVCLENFSIVIFDRWGEKVFESKDPNFCWDGTFRGITMDAQVFVYYIKARFSNLDKPVIKKGNISLIK